MRVKGKKQQRGVIVNNRLQGPASLLALEPRMMFDGAAVTTAIDTLAPLPNDVFVRFGADTILGDGFLSGPQPALSSTSNHSFETPSSVSTIETSDPIFDNDLSILGSFYAIGDASIPSVSNETGLGGEFGFGGLASSDVVPNAIIFIDTSVAGYDALVAEWQYRGTVVLIDSTRDGIEQVMTALAGRSNLDAIHFVSHGSQNNFVLGTTTIGIESITGSLSSVWAAIGARLSADGDILIYGCNVSLDDAGQSFIDALAIATGADVAASTDDTGAAALGGDWTLEARTGVIEATALVSDQFEGLLQLTNSVGWTIAGNVGTQTIDGVGVTITLAAGTAAWSGTTNNTFNPLLPIGTWGTNIAGAPSLVTVFNNAGVVNGTATVTITFDQAVTNPIINIDRLGGLNAGTVGSQTSNSALFTLTTPGATLTDLGSQGHFAVTATTIIRTTGVISTGGESSANTATGTAAGSVRVNGTFTTITFTVSASFGDGFELGVTLDAPPNAQNDAFGMNENATLSGNLLANNGSGVDSDITNDALTINAVNGAAFTAGTPIALTNGTLTIVNAATGAFTFTPRANFYGTQTFTYTVRDANGGSDTATVTIDVNDTPVVDLNSGTTSSQMITNGGTPGTAGWTVTGTGGVSNGGWAWSTDNTTGTLTQSGLTGWASGNGPSGAAQLSFNFGWNNGVPDAATAATVNVTVGGVIYATITTGTPGTIPGTATITYLNGATGSPGTVASSTFNAWTPTNVTINLPTTVANTGDLVFAYSSAGGANDDMWIDAVSAITVTDATAGNDFTTTFTEGGAAVSIADTDNTIRDGNDTNMESATITLTNPQTGDQFLVNGSAVATGTLTGGISYTISGNTVTLTGSATEANYAAAIRAIQFNNTSEAPSATARIVNVTVNDGNLNSNTAVATINVIPVNDPPTAVNDTTLVVNEDTAGTTVNVLTNDTDPDGGPLTITSASATNGTVVINANGTITFTPNANYNGPATITYSISDGNGGTSTATVPVTVTAGNDAPTTVGSLPSQVNVDAASGINVATAGGFADIDGPTAIYSATGLPLGLFINATTGVITGTIDRSASQSVGGVYNVVVTRSDGSLSATQSFSWTVTNPAPTAVNDTTLVVNEDTAGTTVNVLANDTDPDGDPLTVTSASATNGTVVVNANGTITFTPNANYNGSALITYTISDGQGGTSTATIPVTVNAVNDAPTIVGTLPSRSNLDATAGINVATSGGFTDVDNASLTYSAAGLPAGLTINSATGAITGTIDRSASQGGVGGVYSVTVTATDAGGLAATQTFSWTVTNPAPTAVNDTTLVVDEDTAGATVNVLANDTDPDGDPLTVVSASATNGTVVVNANGTITFTPNANYNGSALITYTISDGQGGTSTATIPVTVNAVNDAPTTVGNLPPQTNVDAASGINLATAGGFADIDGPTAVYSATGLPLGLSIDAATGVITGTIDRSASQSGGGVYNVVVTRSDGSLSATQSFSWTVTNPAPSAANDTTLVVNEDTAGTTVNVLANDTDPDGDPLTVVSASATNGTVVVNANGTITFTPNANYNGPALITYTISDGQGGTASATIPVTVNAVNDAPTTVGNLPPQSNVDAASGVSVATSSGFTDLDNATLTYAAAGLPAGLTIDTATGLITGTVDRSASQGGTGGVYSVSVTATDAGGLTATQTFSWTVTNPAPTAANDTASTAEDTPIPSINVRANDSDPDGDPLTVTSASAANGTVTINPDGTLRYEPNANFNGTDTITYAISDGQGGTSTATVTVTVGAVNDAPTPVGTLAPQTNVDAATGISVPTAGGFADVDNATLEYSVSGLPAGLTIDAATGVISGTIDPAASQGGAGGVYSVTVTATDAGGLATTQTFSWTVTNPAPNAVDDTATTNEDTPVLISVLPNDSDPDGDPLSVIAASATVGVATIVGNQVQYTPPANFNGTATITYTISDGNGGTSTATITVTVNPVNDAPVATPIAATTTSDGATISVPVAANFSDVDGDTLSFVATGLPPGLSIDPVTGVISGTITPDASQTNGGVYTATITVSDGNGGTVAQTITFNVGNPAPTATNDSASTAEDTPVTISPLANDSDPDGDPLTITSASALNGTVVINPDGTVTYTPNPGYNGTDTITYTISDGNGGTSTASITIAVANVNDVPVTSGSIGNQTNLDSQIINLPVAGAFSDPDGDTLSFTATGLPAGLLIDPVTGVISGTIDHSASQLGGGAYAIVVTANDGRGGTVTQSFSWTVTNPAPGAVNDVATTNEDTAVQIPVLANDVDPDGDPLTVTAASAGNGTVVILPNGALQYTPNTNFNGTDTIFYTVTDSEGGVSTASVTVTVNPVNDGPTTVGLPNQNRDDGGTVSIPTAPAFSDVDGDALTFNATGLPTGLSIDPATGLITGTLAADASENGPYIVIVTATDPSGASVTTSFVFGVQNVPPIATNDTAATPEDTPVTVAVLTNDVDPDGDPLVITSASATNGTVVVNANGTVTFTPAPNFNGVATVTYTVSDGNGGIATATLTIDVAPVNDAPTSLPIPNQANVDGAFYSANAAPFFSDLDGDALTFSATGLPAGLAIDPATGIVSGTIDANASQINGGVYSITVTATDAGGATTSQTFTGTVTNPAPTATNDSATTAEDTPIPAINVLGNDTDPDGDPLTVTAASAPNGTVTINPDGTLNYVPNANFNGTDTITYTISDGDGGTSTAAVTVTVTPVNDVPVAVNDNATTNEDQPVTIGVLGNDSDVDGDPLTVTAATSPNGTVVINPDGTIAFTPAANFNGPTTITYTISDGNGGTATATVNLTVNAVNDAPVANPSNASTAEDTPVVVPVLANDTDVDGDPLTVTAATAPNGTIVINPDGTVTYTPNANFNGTDTITYTISDGQGGFSTSTVTVSVGLVNDAPTTTPIATQTSDDADVVSLPVAGNFSDLDGDTLSFAATGLPTGLTMDPVTGIISGTIDPAASQGGPNADGIYSVTVTADDGIGGTVSQTFTYTVANPAPAATNDVATTNEDAPVTVAVLANDSDPDGDLLTVTSATAPNGTVVINPDGTVTYTPNANFNGTDTITYTISDGNGGTSTATVTVTVNAVNDAPVVDTPLPAQTEADGALVSFPVAGNFSDLDGDTLSFTATGLPLGLSINAAGVISGTIDPAASQGGPNADGIYTVTVTASDGNGGTVTTSFVYTVTNPAPTATDDNATTNEDAPVTISVLTGPGADSDPDGDPLTVTSATSPDGTVVINPDGTITFTPALNFNGTTTITYAISDGNGGTSTATVNVTVDPVNDAPTADPPLSPQTNSDADAINFNVSPNFADLDGDTLTFTATGLPLGATISAAGVITGPLDNSASLGGPNGDGIYTVTVTANDGNGGTVTSTFVWTVTNPAPVAADDVATTSEDAPVIIAVLGNDNDPDGDALTVTGASAPNGSVAINPDGTVTYTPDANFTGTDIITYTISDGEGGTSTATVAVTVSPLNDAPATSGLPSLFDIDSAVVSIPVGPAFSDTEGDTLSFSAAGLPAGLAIDPVTGTISGTIANNASTIGGGIYAVTITADDGNGGITSTTFTWTISNTAPSANDDVAATSEETPVTFAVLTGPGADTDPDNDPLTVVSATATNGSVLVNPDGTLTYTPNADFNGTATVIYLITDGNGGFSTATAVITVAPVNDAPDVTPLPDRANLDSDAISIPAGAQFSDREGDTLAFSATGLPTGLSIDPVTGLISGTIDPGASAVNSGVYSITVFADDSNGGVSSTTFTWTISNIAPTAANDTASTNEDTPVTIAVRANDNDPDGDPLTIATASAPNGTVVINPDGTITYTPNTNFNGTDTITYTVSDGNGGTATATVTVSVASGNDAPTVAPLPALANVDGANVSVPVAANFNDLDGDTLSFSAAGLPLGLNIDSVTGVISGVIDPAASQGGAGGIYTVTVTASDGNGGLVSTTFNWAVTNPPPVATNDTATTGEEVPVIISVRANDNDPDGDALTVITASAPNGTVAINPDGTVTYTPNVNFNGTDTITYTISDGNGGTSTATVTVTVAPGNDTPTVAPLPALANADGTSISVPVAGNFNDLDGDTLSFDATGLPAGLMIDSATGIISGIIDPAASQGGAGGIYSVTVTANDGNGGTVSTTFNWTVTNPPPVAANDTATTAEDTPVTVAVLGNDNDPDGDPLTVTAANAGNGVVLINPDGTVTYTPNANFNGTDTISYTISDGNGGTTTATVTVSVGPVNDAPVSTPIAPLTNPDSATVSVPVAANFSDVDNATLTFSATGLPVGLVIDPVTGVISGTIDPAASQGGVGGIYGVTVTATDAGGLTSSQTFAWTVTNPPPVAVNDLASTPEDFPVNINVLANDSDPDGDLIRVTVASAGNGTVTILPNGTIDYTPNANFNGVETITYTISDGNGGFSTATVTVTVGAQNDPPVALDDTTATNEDTPVTIAVLGNDSDLDGNTLNVVSATAPNGTVVINPDGTITFTPNANFNGVETITYTIGDGNGGFATATITVVVAPANDAPVAANDTATTPEDAPVTVAVLANDSDVDGDPLTVTSASTPDGQVVINPDGTITFTPNPNFNGTTTVTYVISDGNGGTATATLTLTVAAVNDVPVANPSTATTNEDTPVVLPVLANDSDLDGDPLSVTAATAQNGTVTILPDGTLRYVPDANFNGTDTVTYTISDGQGGTATSTVTVTVNPVNDAPVAGNDNAITPEDSPITIPVLANDTDADGNPLTVTAATSPNGSVVINPDGTITFTPNPNFNGPTTISYVISDGQGGTTTATVAVNVTPVNDPPVARPDTATTPEDAPVVIAPLANDTDLDGNPLAITAASSPNGNVVINANGTITFTPDANFNGPTTITYAVSDGQGGTATTTIAVNVTAVNDPPVARNDVFTMDEDTTARIPVLSNDFDLDGDALTVTAASSPNGTVVINADGTIRFTPAPNFFGTATINYTISDGRGGTATAIATVNVVNINELPVDGDEVLTTIGGVQNVIPVLANATDIDGDRPSIFTATVDVGTITINANGTITYVAPYGYSGPAEIVYVVSDGRGGFDRSVVVIDVIEAAADMNALIGANTTPAIPDGWRVEEVSDQQAEFISVPLIINQTANDFRSLNGTPFLFGHRPLLNAVNGINWLGGTPELDGDGQPITQTVEYLDRIRDLRFGHDRLFDPRWSDFVVQSLTGFSVRQLDTGNEQLMIESVVRDRVIYMEIRDIGKDGEPRIVEYQLRNRDGSPLPDWIRMDQRGLAIIERPVDADEIHLIVRAIRADGKVVDIAVVVQGATGEIQLDAPLAGKKIAAAESLAKTLASASVAANDEAARLTAAFNNQA